MWTCSWCACICFNGAPPVCQVLMLVLGYTHVNSTPLHPPLRCQTLDMNVWVSYAPGLLLDRVGVYRAWMS